MSLPRVIADLKRFPNMYVRVNTFDAIVALVDGYNIAMSGGLLVGFREWLIVRVDGSTNLSWSQIIFIELTEPGAKGDQAVLIGGLFSFLEEFMIVREGPEGLRRIFAAYEKWLKRQEWYTPTSPHWIDS